MAWADIDLLLSINIKPAARGFRGWWEGSDRRASVRCGCRRIDAAIFVKLNATDVGTSVAEESESKDWLNCYAETRPQG